MYLFGCLSSSAPKTVVTEARRHRDVAVTYHVPVHGDKVRICKKAFQNLHCISQSKVDHIANLLKNGQPTAPASQRGKHAYRPNAISEEQREEIRTHIRSYPAEKSHYSRSKNPNKLYLAPTLSINIMYKQYRSLCIANSNPNPNPNAVNGRYFSGNLS